jgi:hypothetical protein
VRGDNGIVLFYRASDGKLMRRVQVHPEAPVEAPTTEASDYAGIATCRLCDGKDRHCFDLGIGDALIIRCPVCGVENGLSAHDRKDVACRYCSSAFPFPESLKAQNQLLVCYECLRAGKAAMTKDAEFGMVSWDQAFEGVTHGIPRLRTDQFEIVPIDPDEDWYGVRVPNEHLWELLRTPGFHSLIEFAVESLVSASPGAWSRLPQGNRSLHHSGLSVRGRAGA